MSFSDAINGTANVILNSCFKDTVENFDNVDMKNPDSIREMGNSYSGILTKACFPADIRHSLTQLEELFSCSFNNYGVAYYNDRNQMTAFNYPKVALVTKGDESKPYLVIGSDDDELGYHQTLIPIEVRQVKIDDGISETTEFRYFFNFNGKKIPCSLVSSTNNERTYNYLAVKHTNSSGGITNFHISFKLERSITEKKGDPTSEIYEKWEAGRFLLILGNLRSTGMSISYCFKSAFINKQFPAEGVLMVLTNPSIGERDSKDKGGGKYITSRWNIVMCSHPELIVNGFKDGVQFPLKDADFMTTYNSFNGCKFILANPEYLHKTNHYYYVHITSPKENLNHLPEHVFSRNKKRLSMFAKKNFETFLGMVEAVTQEVQETKQLAGGQPKQLTAQVSSSPQVATDAEIADAREALGFGGDTSQPIEVKAELVGAVNGNGKHPENYDNNPL